MAFFPCLAESPTDVVPTAPGVVTEILSAWEQRVAKVQSARLTWQVELERVPEMANYRVEFSAAVNSSSTSDIEQFELLDNNVRYEATRWYAELSGEFADFDKEFLFERYVQFMRRGQDDLRSWDRKAMDLILVRNDREHREYFRSTTSSPSLGIIRDFSAALSPTAVDEIPACLFFWPALMAFRPLTALEITLPDHGLTVQADLSTIGQRKCRVLTGQFLSGAQYKLWVDPEEEFSPVRMIVSLDGRDLQQFDIDHKKWEGVGWTPNSWGILVMNSSDDYPGQAEVFQSAHFQVASTEVNIPLIPERFELEFPSGTLIGDRVSGKEFILLDNHPGRQLSPEESRILAGRSEPEAIELMAFPYRTTLIGSALVIALGLLISLRRKRIRNQSHRTSQIVP